MKKLFTVGSFIITLILISTTTSLAQETGEIKIGGGLIYGSEIENIGIRADGYYRINQDFRVGAALGYFFPKDLGFGDLTWFEIDFNGHYIFYEEAELMAYGLAGINVMTLSYDIPGSEANSELGLNLGAGLEYLLEFGTVFGELKLAGLGGDGDQLVLGAGVRFPI